MPKIVKIDGYKFELFERVNRGRQKRIVGDIQQQIIRHLKKSGVTDKAISDLTKLNLSISYINQKYRKEVII